MKKIIFIFMFLFIVVGCNSKEMNEVDNKNIIKLMDELKVSQQNMIKMNEKLRQGENKEAKGYFWKSHDFFHDVDPIIRRKDALLAEDVWNLILLIETEYETENENNKKLIEYSDKVIDLYDDIQQLLMVMNNR